MKVKNIAFSGFAAAILAAGAANAATVTQIASKQYVDDKVGAEISSAVATDGAIGQALADKADKTALETLATKEELDAKADASALEGLATKEELAAKQNTLTQAANGTDTIVIGADGKISVSDAVATDTELAGKEDAANKKTSITEENKASTTDFPTIGAVVTYTTNAISGLSNLPVDVNNITDGSITGAKLQDGSITTGKLSTELQEDIAGKADKITVTADQVGNVATLDANGQYQVGTVKAADLATKANVSTAITEAVADGGAVDTAVDNKITAELAEGGTINTALADKANTDDVYSKTQADTMFDAKLPVPGATCAAGSGLCVLSVTTGSDGKTGLSWVDVTAPVNENLPQ